MTWSRHPARRACREPNLGMKTSGTHNFKLSFQELHFLTHLLFTFFSNEDLGLGRELGCECVTYEVVCPTRGMPPISLNVANAPHSMCPSL